MLYSSGPAPGPVSSITIHPARRLQGEITVPGDKSISHRAVLFNAIATGDATVTNFLPGEDCLSTIACMRALGVTIETDLANRIVRIEGRGLHGLQEADDILNAGNSGTTMRLLAGLLSGYPFLSILTGDVSLRSRPMGRVIGPLQSMGARISARHRDTLAPLVIRGGSLSGLAYNLPVASAQLKSCLLLAGLYTGGETVLSGLIESRDHSERMLTAMGAGLSRQGASLVLSGPTLALQAMDVEVPGDISSAAFWLVAASAHPEADLLLRKVGINPTRNGLLEVLLEMGADISIANERLIAGEPVADLRVRSARLKAAQVSGTLISRLVDEIPALAVAALFAAGTTCISDASELRIKETDRIAAIAGQFASLGAVVQTAPDGLSLAGPALRLQGGQVDSRGDHRLAMALGVAGLLLPPGEVLHIINPECADVSYPGFWQDLARVSQ